MKWKGRRKSSNVERRGRASSPIGGFGRLGTGGIILLIVFSLLTGQNPLDTLLSVGGVMTPSSNMESEYVARSPEEERIEEFLSVVLADTEDVWHQLFNEEGGQYREPKLRLYQDRTSSACGAASSRMGPFYCGADETVYIDVAFAKDLRTIFGAEGEFPFAYVLAHEVGHHVQKQTGKLTEVQSLRGRVSDIDYNNEMVKLELQADYYAGVVAHYLESKGYLDPRDVGDGMDAAAGVGDDRIQEMQGGKANPDTFQHGSSEQRQRWFLNGYKYGDFQNGNTFSVRDAKDL
ncbi:MAG: neutral zinc metallopeptidase [Tissierellia bacterium]|nr:neutral zinc metallopeptidase [Tissierellia bacterium]